MSTTPTTQPEPLYRMPAEEMDRLVGMLVERGFRVLGPVLRDGVLALDRITGARDLPRGVHDEQSAGRYRATVRPGDPRWFAAAVGADSLKRYLFPSRTLLVELGPDLIATSADPPARTPLAFLGVRACDLAAVAVQARVFEGPDDRYAQRLASAFLVGVHCSDPAATCFCPSMDTGPEFRARDGLDLLLTERVAGATHDFLVEPVSAAGAALVRDLGLVPAPASERGTIDAQLRRTRAAISRRMPPGVREAVGARPESPRWDQVAARCLACGNCTAVCPTCFCSDVEDTKDLDGTRAQRWQVWDSCFHRSHSHTHAVTVRASTRARYRQWLTHKLSTWWDQYGSSGCTGCGRCITWCPVGIDLTEEAGAIAREHADER